MPVDLKMDWASHKAAKFACENWHYSKCLPIGKMVKVGVWESGKYIGCVIFSRGTARHLGTAYGQTQETCVELTRVALKAHKSPVSRILSISLKFLKKSNPKLQLVVSFAAKSENHHGGIYQATNWIYTGETAVDVDAVYKGRRVPSRTINQVAQDMKTTKADLELNGIISDVRFNSKHRYLMPLNAKLRGSLQLLSKPYPKRVGSVESDTPAIQAGEGGANPTSTLQLRQHNV
mgnify:CR=1 FL=1